MRLFDFSVRKKPVVEALIVSALLSCLLTGCSREEKSTETADTEYEVMSAEDASDFISGKVDEYVNSESDAALKFQEEYAEPIVKNITFTASGDDLVHRPIFTAAQARSTDGTYDFTYVYENVSDFFKNHDINWINQETLLNNTLEVSSYPTFSTPGQMGYALYDANFRIFNVSTNHTYDKGSAGVEATMQFYENDMPDDICVSGLYHDGQWDDIPIYEYDGVKFAFLAYTYGTNGIPNPTESDYRVILLEQEDIIQEQIKLAKEEADFVIVSAHWGIEGSHTVSDEQRTMARKLVDWGADMIVGTHPHVVQDAEWITTDNGRKVFCCYSLGNFISGQLSTDNLIGVTLDCSFRCELQEDGSYKVRVEDPRLIPNTTVYGWGVTAPYVMWYGDVTDDILANHGVNSYTGYTYDIGASILKNSISDEFLVMPDQASYTDAMKETKSPDEEE